jgi:integrase
LDNDSMPTTLLNARFVATLKPRATRTEYFDSLSPGLSLRLSPSGVKTWAVLYRPQVDGATPRAVGLRRLTLGRYPALDLKAARKRAAVARGLVANGQDPAAAKQAARQAALRTGDTVKDLAADYLKNYAKKHKRSWPDDDRMLNVEVLPHWKARKVRELTRRDVRVLIEAIAERGSPITANRCLALVRKMLNYAITTDWIDANPAALMAKPGAEQSRERVLTDDEIRLVWAACASERVATCAVTRLRLVTAQRGAEVVAMKWADLDRATGWWTIPATVTKNKKAHRVPLTAPAIAILDTVPQLDGSDWVFPNRIGTRPITDAKQAGRRIGARVLKRLQEDDLTVAAFDFRGHDLRRTASTKMAEAGVSQGDIARVLNHAEGGPRATHVYNRYAYDAEKRRALETWARVLSGILDKSPATRVVAFPSRG